MVIMKDYLIANQWHFTGVLSFYLFNNKDTNKDEEHSEVQLKWKKLT